MIDDVPDPIVVLCSALVVGGALLLFILGCLSLVKQYRNRSKLP